MSNNANENPKISGWTLLGPGLLVAATGVGAGDLATASFTGMQLGVTVLWAVVVGAALKFVLTEGLARYQLSTGESLLHGSIRTIGMPFTIVFGVYFFLWSYVVGGALVSACGAAGHALIPVFDDAVIAKRVLGVAHSIIGVVLVMIGGYRLFENVMRVCIGAMFICVIITAIRLGPDWAAVAQGVVMPWRVDLSGEGLRWTVALMGGVGGTLTILCYGYWIREENRAGFDWIRPCRIDLAVGYIVTAVFGIAMVIIGSRVESEGSGAALIVSLGNTLGEVIGPTGRYIFLLGAYGAIFSSLLGVWQCVPLIFADFVTTVRRDDIDNGDLGRSQLYTGFLIVLAVAACTSLMFSFKSVQLIYAIIGALFMPFLAIVLLYMNGPALPEKLNRNRHTTIAVLVACIVFFLVAAYFDIRARLT